MTPESTLGLRSPRRSVGFWSRLAYVSCSLAIVAACSPPSVEEQLAQAKAALEARDTRTAVVKLKEAVAAQPDAPQARAALGEALLASGDPVGALVELQRARDLGAPLSDVAALTVRALIRSGRAADALSQFGAVALDAPAAEAALRAEVARAYLETARPGPAREAVEAALRADAGNPSARLLKARLDAAQGRSEEAVSVVEEVLQVNPGDLDALLLRGEMAMVGGRDIPAAVADFERVLQLDPASLPAHLMLLRIAAAVDDPTPYEARVQAMSQALPRHPETVFAQTQLALRQGNLVVARERSQQLLSLAPEDARAQYTAAVVQWRSGALPAAESHLAKAVQLAPTLAEPRRSMGQLLASVGQPGRALDVLQPLVVASAPADAAALQIAGQAEVQRGRLDVAESYFQRAAQARPEDQPPRTALALLQISRGEVRQGLSELERLAAADGADIQADLTLISTLLAQRDFDRALKAVDGLQAKAPDQPLPYALRGRILLDRNQLDAARRNFERALELDPNFYPGITGLVDLDAAAGRWPAVIERLQAQLNAAPRNYSALVRLVQAQLASGADPATVRARLEQSVQSHPADKEPRLMLVSLLLDLRDLSAARVAAQQAAAALPDDADVQDALGRVLLAVGDARQAVAAFGKAANLRPTSALAHLRLGDAQVRAGDVPGGRSSLERARQIDPQSLDAHRAVLNLALSERRYNEALAVARDVQQRQPRLAIGYLLEADVYLNQRNLPEALRLVREAHTREPSSDLAVRVHGLQVLANQTAEADRFAADWLRRNPQDVQFVGHLGTQALQRGDFAAAERQYQRVLELKPDDPVALNNVAWSMLQLNRPEPAVPLARRANEVLPNQAALQNTLATALKNTGNLREAADWQRRSVASSNGEPRYRLQLAEMLLALNERSQAREELRALEALGDSFPQRDKVLELARQAR